MNSNMDWRLIAIAAFAAALTVMMFERQAPLQAQGVPQFVGISNASGNVAAATATATLPGIANRTTFLCGYIVSGLGATAGVSATLTITGLASGTQTLSVGVPAGATTPMSLPVTMTPACQPASALNTAITVSIASFGSGNTNASIMAWGYQF